MPLTHVHKLFAVSDAKVKKITADPSGGTTTFATAVDVPGIKEIGLDFEINAVSLRGDHRELDAASTLVAVTGTFTHAKVSLDALPVFLGGTTTDTGTTPNQIAKWRRVAADVMPYFSLEGKTPTGGSDDETGDAHLLIAKAKITGYSLGLAEEDYRIMSGSFRGVYRLADDILIDLVANETAVAIS